jgi:hypothetical protein
MSQNSFFLRYGPGTVASGDVSPIVKASSTYGGFTVIAAQVFPGIAGTLDVVLQNYGVSGTVAGGTVAGISGGSAALVADTVVSLAITAANAFIDDGEWLVLKAVAAALGEAVIVVECVPGVVSQG